MKLITRDTDYALQAMCLIAGSKDEVVAVSELVKRLKIPGAFLRKILQVLNKKEILRSYKGKGGGFLLARAPKSIFLLDLIEVFQGPLKINECLFKKLPCPNIKSCRLKRRIDRIQQKVISELKSITLASLTRK